MPIRRPHHPFRQYSHTRAQLALVAVLVFGGASVASAQRRVKPAARAPQNARTVRVKAATGMAPARRTTGATTKLRAAKASGKKSALRPAKPSERAGQTLGKTKSAQSKADRKLAKASKKQLKTTAKALKKIVAGVRVEIGTLKANIKTLETRNSAKAHEMRSITSDIESRKKTVEADFESMKTVAFFAAAFGLKGFVRVSLVSAIDSDIKIQEFNAELAKVKTEQSGIERMLRDHEATKATLETIVNELQGAESAILAKSPRSFVAHLDGVPKKLQKPLGTVHKSEKLLANIQGQLSNYSAIRESAARVGVKLDVHIERLVQTSANAQAMVVASRKSLLNLVKLSLDPNPEGAAGRWLEKRVQKDVAALLKDLEMKTKGAVQSLATELFPQNGPAADLLKKQFIAAMYKKLELAS